MREAYAQALRTELLRTRHSPRLTVRCMSLSRHTVDVVTGENELVHVQTDTCGSTAFVQIKLWVDF